MFFTADLHLGHANIIKHCNRPFSSVNEMDEYLLASWNSRVRPNDSVYIIGDLIFRSSLSPDDYLSRLNGKKHLILGNHDKDWVKKVEMSKHFVTVERFLEFSDGQHRITMCHYPMMSWNHISKGSYMIHGHIHNNYDAIYSPLMADMPNLLNASVEINNYQPVKFNELLKNNVIYKTNKECDEEFFDKLKKESIKAIHKAQVAFEGVAESLSNPSENNIQSWVDEIRYGDKIDKKIKTITDYMNDESRVSPADRERIYNEIAQIEQNINDSNR
jgi:calcineurin-like phosphoesterase family protein